MHIQTFLFTVPTLNLEAGQSHTHFRSVLVCGCVCVCVSVSVGVAFVCCTESKAITTEGTMGGGALGRLGWRARARARGPSYYAMYCLCNENVYGFCIIPARLRRRSEVSPDFAAPPPSRSVCFLFAFCYFFSFAHKLCFLVFMEVDRIELIVFFIVRKS